GDQEPNGRQARQPSKTTITRGSAAPGIDGRPPACEAADGGLEVGAEVPDERAVRDLMWRQAGLLRSRADLESAVSGLARWRSAVDARRRAAPGDRSLRRLASLTTVGFLIARAALRREESRGGHYRADFPERDDINWLQHWSDALRA
ncbi:MAG TPA: hypothetical protein VM819_03035, partial [Vicinamibacterales bacterium]|nr:hypothetical protein [Vicinamibacterales bacterium]